MIIKLVTTSALLVTLGSFTSCSKLEEMGKNAENAGIAAGESREEIANGRLMTRSGNTSKSREEALERLLKTQAFEGKEKHAAKYMYGFEFQFWTGQKYDNAQRMDLMKKAAVEELFKDLATINKKPLHKNEHSPLRTPGLGFGKKKINREMSLYAMAVASHVIHDYQKHFVVPKLESRADTISVYSLIKDGIKAGLDFDSGMKSHGEMKAYQIAVHENMESAIELAHMRLNMLLTINLAKNSPIKDSKLEALMLLMKKNRVFTSKFLDMNASQKAKSNKYLDGAKKVKDFLLSIGEEVKLDQKLVKFYTKMKVHEVNDINKSSKTFKRDSDLLVEHRKLLGEFFDVDGKSINKLN